MRSKIKIKTYFPEEDSVRFIIPACVSDAQLFNTETAFTSTKIHNCFDFSFFQHLQSTRLKPKRMEAIIPNFPLM